MRRISEDTERRFHASRKRCPFSCRVHKQSVGDVWIAQLDRKRVPQARSIAAKVLSP